MDWRIVAFTLVLSCATVLVFGLVPALAGTRVNLAATLRSAGNRGLGGIRQSRARALLVSAEIGLAVVLLIGAGLLIRTSLALSQIDPGFDANGLLTMRTSLSDSKFSTTASRESSVHSARERIASIPGVVNVVSSCCIPMQPGWGAPFNITGRINTGLYTGSHAVVFSSAGYFDIFKIPVLRGRDFNERDQAGSAPVAIINEALAKLYWAAATDPLADQIQIGGGAANLPEYAREPARQIIGIVGDIRAEGLAIEPAPMMYVPQAQLSDALGKLVAAKLPTVWVIRTQGAQASVAKAAQAALRTSTGLAVTDVRTMPQVIALSVARQRLHRLLMTLFGGSALLLAAIGVFGLLAFSVQQRRQEIGIRMAVGAAPGDVGRMICRDGMRVIVPGLTGGLIAAYFLANWLQSMLFGVDAHDLVVFFSIPTVLMLVALTALAIPALRASRINPVDALRGD
jgi:putative ABC transport system permease protein